MVPASLLIYIGGDRSSLDKFFVIILCIQFPKNITAHKTPSEIVRTKSSVGKLSIERSLSE